MSDEKLTVAELLARRNKERGEATEADDRPRRRRRSLDEGGVSVAELTGSIPKVRAEGPRRGAHAAGEDEDQGVETPGVAERYVAGDGDGDVAAAEAHDAREPVAEEPVAEEPVIDEPAVDEPAADEAFVDEPYADERPADELAAADAVGEPEVDEDPVAPRPEATESEFAESEFDDDGGPVDDRAVAEPETPAVARTPFAVPSAVPVDPRPVLANDETGEITFTFTKFHDARTASEPVAEAGPVAREVLSGSMAYDDRPTNVIPVVEDDAVDETDAAADATDANATAVADDAAYDESAYRDAEYADADYTDAEYSDTGYAESEYHDADYADAGYADAEYADAEYRDDEFRDAEYRGTSYADADHTDEFDSRDVHDRGVDPLAAAVPAAAAAAVPASKMRSGDDDLDDLDRRDDRDDVDGRRDEATASAKKGAKKNGAAKKNGNGDVEDDSLSIGLLIAQTIVGLLLGALVFALFVMLWMTLPTAVVVVIGLAFAFGLVIGVNLIRRERDRLTPILAGLVGLVVAFAPWFLTML